MSTTIQIKKETKEALFNIKNRLERELGRRLSYDEVIEYLLEKNESTFPKKVLSEFAGTLETEAKEIYANLRKEYREND
ncbi:MAG: hypothetical protein K9W45_04295 [Candidatus Heimdallarchaeum aukensis]|uniref:Uncharacterized protein n=1 Tax=Candidatus Heimdallarchaeum aukensis TaxID=2876573 RepID=A0A9Y1BNW6_9ARCH|nr:MAG: hypothetical protein K9W45_04295 [Candidatus Heimdallarchaeum aukensis]